MCQTFLFIFLTNVIITGCEKGTAMLLVSCHACQATHNLIETLHSPKRRRTEPVIRPEHPWESGGVYFQGSVIRENGLFRMWYSAIGTDRDCGRYLAYAESGDGLCWKKPLRAECPLGEWPRTNVLYGRRFAISGPGIQRYQTPRGEYRYFMAFDSHVDQHAFQGVPRTDGLTEADKLRLGGCANSRYTPDFDWNAYWPADMRQRGLYLADSVDGLRWEPQDGRHVLPGQSDGDHTVVWDPKRREYRMYFRGNRFFPRR